MEFKITDDVLDLKVNVAIVVIEGMKNKKTDEDFNNFKEQELLKVKKDLSAENILTDDILQGFWKLHERIGKTSKKDMSSPENLLNMLLENGTIPSINLIVDIYNLVSVKSKLALGSHDIDNISGNVTLRLTDGSEKFLPIGYSKLKPISRGEYSYIDDNNDILCRMEVRQVEKTKVTENSKNCMYIVQGNENTPSSLIESAVNDLIDLTTKYCGGNAKVIYKQY